VELLSESLFNKASRVNKKRTIEKQMSNSNKTRIATVTAMALAFSKLPAATQEKLTPKTVDKLEKTLLDAARETTVKIPAKAAQTEAVEIVVKTVKDATGGQLHVKTPFSTPFLMNCKMLPEGARVGYDRDLGVTIFGAQYRKDVIAVIQKSFEQCKRPHVLNVDGKRSAITAGQASA